MPLSGMSDDITEGDAKITGEAQSHGGFIELTATVALSATAACARCGKEFPWSDTLTVKRPVAKSLTGEDDEYILAADGVLDIAELFAEEVVLSLPSKVVCSEDCLGLCPHCGKDLNSGKCSCTGKELDPRLAILQSLLK